MRFQGHRYSMGWLTSQVGEMGREGASLGVGLLGLVLVRSGRQSVGRSSGGRGSLAKCDAREKGRSRAGQLVCFRTRAEPRSIRETNGLTSPDADSDEFPPL